MVFEQFWSVHLTCFAEAIGPRKWTSEALKATAKKYNAVRTWREEERSAYSIAARLGISDTPTRGIY